ncbi:MAG TPA: class II fructose-bisphosphate aldolase [Armatimonadota bacterium]|jgi:ketose-bisphosphate aldolase
MNDVATMINRARQAGTVIPGFNIPYLPMMAPVVQALRDTDSVGLIMVARLEWVKFQSGSLQAIREEYEQVKDARHTRLHLDHVPVIDEDDLMVDYLAVMREALALGYESVMVDGSRLPFADNVRCTQQVVAMAHAAGVPVEAELGAVLGHEAGPLPPYDELFASGKGFTDIDEARRFVTETGTDWLSVAIGNVHGAISAAARTQQKIEARLQIDHLDAISRTTEIPLVLHGGTGIRVADIRAAMQHGIAKINVATAIRQPYERAIANATDDAQQAVYLATRAILENELGVAGNASLLNP